MNIAAITLETGMLTAIVSVACSVVSSYVTQRVVNTRHQLRIDQNEAARIDDKKQHNHEMAALRGEARELETRVRATENQGAVLANQNAEILKAIEKLGDKIDKLKE